MSAELLPRPLLADLYREQTNTNNVHADGERQARVTDEMITLVDSWVRDLTAQADEHIAAELKTSRDRIYQASISETYRHKDQYGFGRGRSEASREDQEKIEARTWAANVVCQYFECEGLQSSLAIRQGRESIPSRYLTVFQVGISWK